MIAIKRYAPTGSHNQAHKLLYTFKKDDSDDAMIQGTILVNTAVH